MATRTIRQTAVIRGATPSDIYRTLMDPKRHGALSGQPAKVSSRVGGKWSVGHDIEGNHLTLVKDKKIVPFVAHARCRIGCRGIHRDRCARQFCCASGAAAGP